MKTVKTQVEWLKKELHNKYYDPKGKLILIGMVNFLIDKAFEDIIKEE